MLDLRGVDECVLFEFDAVSLLSAFGASMLTVYSSATNTNPSFVSSTSHFSFAGLHSSGSSDIVWTNDTKRKLRVPSEPPLRRVDIIPMPSSATEFGLAEDSFCSLLRPPLSSLRSLSSMNKKSSSSTPAVSSPFCPLSLEGWHSSATTVSTSTVSRASPRYTMSCISFISSMEMECFMIVDAACCVCIGGDEPEPRGVSA
mmetsp:Transcript_15257/g.32968  ORF Transcript_15257/g.32968 Transcript_15257/m.32968 type:complete len:201 (-) Transcript_15257:292-894(-)